MNNPFLALIILGIIQGIAEFLPISSSGHLVLFEKIPMIQRVINTIIEGGELFVNVSLHFATLIAVVIYLWKEIVSIIKGSISGITEKNFKKSEINSLRNIIVASIPAGIIGLLFHDFFESAFSSALLVFCMLMINGFILLSTRIYTNLVTTKGRNIEEIGVLQSFFIGFFQAFAIIPGISRSGMTITGGMISGLLPEESAKFSFLMAIPVIAGAGILEFWKILDTGIPQDLLLPMIIGMLVTVVVALFSLRVLFFFVKRMRIDIFGYYTILIGVSGIIIMNYV